MKISVIIPVYNAAAYIETAIFSALNQPEVNEIVVVNDGSTDDTLKIVKLLQLSSSKIKIFQHKEGLNKGRSATRNLGIQNATSKYIAFLDADDFYLDNRFTNDKKIFQENERIDGVYNAIGVHFYRDTTLLEQNELELTTVTEKIKPEALFDALFKGGKGHFSLDGLTIKKSVLDIIGYFDESLVVAEDTAFLLKMALKCRLGTGIINKPVALRGVHDNNVFNREDLYVIYRIKIYESLFFWSSKNQISSERINDFLKVIWIFKDKEKNSVYRDTFYWIYLFKSNPQLLFSYISIKYFPIIRRRKVLFSFLYK